MSILGVGGEAVWVMTRRRWITYYVHMGEIFCTLYGSIQKTIMTQMSPSAETEVLKRADELAIRKTGAGVTGEIKGSCLASLF